MTHTGYDPTTFTRALVDVHGNYRSSRLTHEPPDEWISDAVTPRTLRPHLVRAGLFLAIYGIVGAVSAIIFFLTFIAALASVGNDPYGQSANTAGNAFGGVTLLLIILQLTVFVAWIVSLFLPLREPIAEYGMLIEGRSTAAPKAYAWVAQTIAVRRTPFQISAGKVQGVPVLLLTSGRVRAMVVVYAVGSDLYMGWTMWRARSTVVLIGNMIRDMVQSMGVRELASDVRAASTRALRELVHSVIREGVQAAILQPPIDDTAAQANFNQLPALDIPGGSPVPSTPQMPAYQPPPQQAMGYPAGYPAGTAQTSAPPAGYPAAPASAPPSYTTSFPPQPGPYG